MASKLLSRVVWKVSLPIIFIEATETLDHLIDTLFLARVGATELGALAVADALLLIFLILPLALVDGIQILTARRIGENRPGAAGTAFNQGLAMVLILGVVATVLLKVLSPVVAFWVVESEPVGEAVNSYLQLDAYSICLAGVTFAFSALLTSLGKTRAIIPATVILVITDVILNYLFIFGKFGCPQMGMRGAAVGSIGAELATAIFLAVYVWRHFDHRKYGFLQFHRFDHRITSLLGKLSAPLAGQALVENCRWLVFFLIIERVGTPALAIANVVYTCYIIFWIPTEGFSETACSFVSRFVGGNRVHRVGELLRTAAGGAILATIPFILIALVVPQWLGALFALKADMLGEGSASLRVVALAMLVAIPAEMWFTAVVGTGDTAAAFGIELLTTAVMLGVSYLAAIHLAWPIALIWLSVPITWLVCLAASYAWMKSGIWKRLAV